MGFNVERIGTTSDLIEDLIETSGESTPDWGFNPADVQDARECVARQISMRRGQPGFRNKLLKIYRGCCAITGCGAVQVLEACHIIPYLGPQTNHPCNGLLLRTDLHTLFDLGLLTIEPQSMTVSVASQLRDTEYAALHGSKVRIPENPMFAPSVGALQEHIKKATQLRVSVGAEVEYKTGG